jgi:hypothetical protein
MWRVCLLSFIFVMVFVVFCPAGDVTIALLGTNPLTINIKGDFQNEQAGAISILLYFRDDGETELSEDQVSSDQLVMGWGWGTSNETKYIEAGTYVKGGRTYSRVLGYANAGISSLDDYWLTEGIDAIVCTFTTIGKGHVYVELFGPDGLTDWTGNSHTVTITNRCIFLSGLIVNVSAVAIEKDGIVLSWHTENETDCMGYHVWKSENDESNYSRITSQIIPGHGNSESEEYIYKDRRVKKGIIYWYKIEYIYNDGSSEWFGPVYIEGILPLPIKFYLSQNYPNPFNEKTALEYQIPEDCDVSVCVYNLNGQLIAILVQDRHEAGYYETAWNGMNEKESQAQSGVYLIVMKAGSVICSKKMVLAR